jgi:hypothetical protein
LWPRPAYVDEILAVYMCRGCECRGHRVSAHIRAEGFENAQPLRFCSHDAFMFCIALLLLDKMSPCTQRMSKLSETEEPRHSSFTSQASRLQSASDSTSSILLLLMADTLKTPLQTALHPHLRGNMTPYACFVLWPHSCKHWAQRNCDIQDQGSHCCSQGHSEAMGYKDLVEGATLEIGWSPSPQWPHCLGLFTSIDCCW